MCALLAARDRMHERQLDVERQRRRDPVRIDLVCREAFGLEEDLVARSLREAYDLVFDRRTVARADAFDDAGEKRRAVEPAANDLVRALVGVCDPARHLPRVHLARADEAHHRRGIVAGLPFERREIDGAPVESRRRSGLEPAHGQGELAQSRAERLRRGITGAPSFVLFEADVDQSRQERAGGQHHGVRLERHAHLRDHAGHRRACSGVDHREVIDRLLEQREVGLVLEPPTDRGSIESAVRLGTRRSHRRALARVECAELDARLVRRDRHRAAQRIDFLDEMPLADAADRRIAGHLPQCFDAVGEKQRLASHPRARERGLGPGVAAADDNDIVLRSEDHDNITIFLFYREPPGQRAGVESYAKPEGTKSRHSS